MRNSNVIMAASGTATLECALIGTPTLVAYKMSALSGFLAKKILDIKYVSLANIIPDKLILPDIYWVSNLRVISTTKFGNGSANLIPRRSPR
ncbi:hypothetical protein [Maridesulfovibrio sp.]|uniref:hypothetical protein n=1 Tax=Maridesulfovibrio sp. TaxID=2795000 RepID=UPI003B00A6B1